MASQRHGSIASSGKKKKNAGGTMKENDRTNDGKAHSTTCLPSLDGWTDREDCTKREG